MSTIGLIAMSAKPFHAGHAGLISWAAKENDEVHLYVSLSDRKRPGELVILGSDMEQIWKKYIEQSLPKNVRVSYGGSPVANVYKELGEANESGSSDEFTIYADPEDLSQNYPEKSLDKYAGNLYHNGQIILKPIQRSQTVNVSGTKMRQYLAVGDKESFVANLPTNIDRDAVWELLHSHVGAPAVTNVTRKKVTKKLSIKEESLLRRAIRTMLS
jgi:ATP sulfurylase